MAGLVTLFVGLVKYLYEIGEQAALWFERNTRFFNRGQKIYWVGPALIGGVYFGVVHLISRLKGLTPGNGLWILLGSILVTFMFVALYIRSGSLWLPIGFHIAWNFCLKGIMGITMSGHEAKAGLLTVELSGNQFLNGGNFGIEISAISVLFYILVAFLAVKIPWNGVVELLTNR